MADYWGLRTIARRLNVAKSTVMEWHDHRGFLMLIRLRGVRRYYYTNDALILAWEIAQCKASHAARRRRLAARQAQQPPNRAGMVGQDNGMPETASKRKDPT